MEPDYFIFIQIIFKYQIDLKFLNFFYKSFKWNKLSDMETDTEKSTTGSSEDIETTNKDSSTTNTLENKTSEDIPDEENLEKSSQGTELEGNDNSNATRVSMENTEKDSSRKDSDKTNDYTTEESITENPTPEAKLENGTASDEKQTGEEELKTNVPITVAVSPVKDDNIESNSSENAVKEETPAETEKVPPPSEYPEFAVIQSFLTMFGVELDLPIVSLVDLDNVFSPNYRLSIDKGIYKKSN